MLSSKNISHLRFLQSRYVVVDVQDLDLYSAGPSEPPRCPFQICAPYDQSVKVMSLGKGK